MSLIVGASGVGKSTLIRHLLRAEWPSCCSVCVPKKVTTRPLRGSGDECEIECISREAFSELLARDAFIVSYESFGHQYGMTRERFSECLRASIIVQAVPSLVAMAMKKKLADYKVVVFALFASPESVRARLVFRGEASQAQDFMARSETALKDRNDYADFVIDASGTPAETTKIVQRQLLLAVKECGFSA